MTCAPVSMALSLLVGRGIFSLTHRAASRPCRTVGVTSSVKLSPSLSARSAFNSWSWNARTLQPVHAEVSHRVPHKGGKTMTLRTKSLLMAISFLAAAAAQAGPSVNVSVFATGGAVSATGPDSITTGNGSIWVGYGNGADSTGASGSSTIVQYSAS